MNTRTVLLAQQPKEVNFTMVLGDMALSLFSRQLTGLEADAVADLSVDKTTFKFNSVDFSYHRIIASVHDQKTKQAVFNAEDFEALKSLPSSLLNTLREKVSEANNDLNQVDIDSKKK